eukprot:TRINITY_DN219_c0_g1_i5.p1 TRINITY_DN219_c0_g1~~TRINITY_DN219_c0_g1_i5.p1  ORF type:complete len:828 (+),score=172.59 TRINITY_DN219_c0_g1_i5:111-2594(+)
MSTALVVEPMDELDVQWARLLNTSPEGIFTGDVDVAALLDHACNAEVESVAAQLSPANWVHIWSVMQAVVKHLKLRVDHLEELRAKENRAKKRATIAIPVVTFEDPPPTTSSSSTGEPSDDTPASTEAPVISVSAGDMVAGNDEESPAQGEAPAEAPPQEESAVVPSVVVLQVPEDAGGEEQQPPAPKTRAPRPSFRSAAMGVMADRTRDRRVSFHLPTPTPTPQSEAKAQNASDSNATPAEGNAASAGARPPGMSIRQAANIMMAFKKTKDTEPKRPSETVSRLVVTLMATTKFRAALQKKEEDWKYSTEAQRIQEERLILKQVRRGLWNSLLLMVLVYNIVAIPYTMAVKGAVRWWAVILNLLLDCVYYVNIYYKFTTPLEVQGHLVDDPKVIRLHYLKHWFIVDLLACLPCELVGIMVPPHVINGWMRANRLLNILHMPSYLRIFFELHFDRVRPAIMSMLKSLCVMYYLVHLLACILMVMVNNFSAEAEKDTEEWLKDVSRNKPLHELSGIDLYGVCFDVSLRSLSSHGSPWPKTIGQHFLSLVIAFTGVAVYATIIAEVANLVVNLDEKKIQFLQKVDEVKDYMTYLRLPAPIQKEILDFYTHTFRIRQTFNMQDASIMDDVPRELQQKIERITNAQMLEKVPIFADVKGNDAFLSRIIHKLQPRVMLPNSIVVEKDDDGFEMFFVAKGDLALLDPDGHPVFWFTSGDFFGELALIFGGKRTATIKAVSYCQLFVLHKDDFDAIGEEFPMCMYCIRKLAEERRQANQKKNEPPPPPPPIEPKASNRFSLRNIPSLRLFGKDAKEDENELEMPLMAKGEEETS